MGGKDGNEHIDEIVGDELEPGFRDDATETTETDPGERKIKQIRANRKEYLGSLRQELEGLLDEYSHLKDPSTADWAVVYDAKKAKAPKEKGIVDALRTMQKVDEILDEIVSKGLDTKNQINDELRRWSKKLVLLGKAQREIYEDDSSFSPYTDSEIRLIVYEIWHVAHLWQAQEPRKSGEPYLNHLLNAAQNLISHVGLTGVQSILATLHHDDIEDLEIHKPEANADLLLHNEALAGPGLAVSRIREETHRLVDGVTNTKKIINDPEQSDAKSFRKFLLGMKGDIKVAYIRLAERLHNVLTIGAMPPKNARDKLLETLALHVPIAETLSLDKIRRALVLGAFSYLNPESVKAFEALREQRMEKQLGPREQRSESELLRRLKALISPGERAIQFIGINPAHIADYTDLNRVEDPNYVPAVELRDPLFEIVVLVSEPFDLQPTIYRILEGLGFEIENYKFNVDGSSIQVFSPKFGGKVFIRVNDARSESKRKRGLLLQETELSSKRRGITINRVLERTEEDPSGIYEVAREEFLRPDITVYTKDYDEIRLPRGSTALDFAAHIHGGLLAKLDKVYRAKGGLGRDELVDPFEPLEDGDVVHVFEDDVSDPDLAWFCFIGSDAKEKLRSYFNKNGRDRRLKLAREYLSRVGTLFGLNPDDMFQSVFFYQGKWLLRTETRIKQLQKKGIEGEALNAAENARVEAVKERDRLLALVGNGQENLVELLAERLEASWDGRPDAGLGKGLDIEIELPNIPGMIQKIGAEFGGKSDEKKRINIVASSQRPAGQAADGEIQKEILSLTVLPFEYSKNSTYNLMTTLLKISRKYPVRVVSKHFKDLKDLVPIKKPKRKKESPKPSSDPVS